MEDRTIHLLQEEIALQIQLEKDVEEDVPEGLQIWTLSNIDMLSIMYTTDDKLLSKSSRAQEIK